MMPAGGKPYGPGSGMNGNKGMGNRTRKSMPMNGGMKGTGSNKRMAPVAKKAAPAKRGSRRMG